jgi:hypothetical protein
VVEELEEAAQMPRVSTVGVEAGEAQQDFSSFILM